MHAVPMCTKLYAWNGCTTHVDTHSIMKCTFSHSCAISFIYYVYSHFLFTNRFLVNLTAFLKEIIKDIKEMWSEMVPKILMPLKMSLMQNLSHCMKKVLHVLLKVWLDTT